MVYKGGFNEMNKYEIRNGIIVRTDTGKRFLTMRSIVEQMNYYGSTGRYTVRKDNQGKEYIDWAGFSAKYYDLEEICELMNGVYNRDMDIISKKHMENKKKYERKHKVPYTWNGRFVFDSTLRKGFWFEDGVTGKIYYTHIDTHRNAIVKLLNDYTENERYITYYSKAGDVIKDTSNDEIYYLISSKDCCDVRDLLNWYDFQLYGKRELPYRRQLM